MGDILTEVQVNIPFTMLYETHLGYILERGINPEIGFHAAALDRFSLRDYEAVAAKLCGRGLSVTFHAPFMDLSPGSPDSMIRQVSRRRLRQVADIVPLFQPRSVVCHSGYDPLRHRDMKEEWIRNSLEVWSWFVEILGSRGTAVMIENVYERDAQEFLEVYAPLKPQGVGFCLDTGHQAAFGRVPLSDWLGALGDEVRQVHLHDNDGDGDSHLALGRGSVDFPLLFACLKARRSPAPIITLEPHREEDLEPCLSYLEAAWPW